MVLSIGEKSSTPEKCLAFPISVVDKEKNYKNGFLSLPRFLWGYWGEGYPPKNCKKWGVFVFKFWGLSGLWGPLFSRHPLVIKLCTCTVYITVTPGLTIWRKVFLKKVRSKCFACL